MQIEAGILDAEGLRQALEGEVCARYGVIQEREVDGRKRMGIMRSTFVIDRKGILRHALYGVKPLGHAADVLELVRDLK